MELNVYRKSDVARGTGSGISHVDTGSTRPYGITRKSACYVGVSNAERYFQNAAFERRQGQKPEAFVSYSACERASKAHAW